jgi:Flp pilus assembly pilin Flp
MDNAWANQAHGAGRNTTREGLEMSHGLLNLYIKLRELATREEGQDLIEYGLLTSMIALSAISGVSHVASAVTTVFSHISSSLA